MNTYDPMKGWVYRHMAPQTDPYCVTVSSTRSVNQLPTGDANGSPRTYLGRTRRTSPAA
jgi:hypothetical protein